MKPISISIKGFNSFLDEQSIDFEELGKMGIFGIFGPTGSGKSSILDAITFALYGKIARDNAREQYININTSQVEPVRGIRLRQHDCPDMPGQRTDPESDAQSHSFSEQRDRKSVV